MPLSCWLPLLLAGGGTARAQEVARAGAAVAEVAPAEEGAADGALLPGERVAGVSLRDDLYVRSDLVLQGITAWAEVPFTVPRGWDLTRSPVLRLEFEHSAELLGDLSSMTVMVNDKAIGSVNLTDANKVDGAIELVVPLRVLELPEDEAEGNNRLQIVVTQHYTRDCEDPFNPSLWTRVSNRSTLFFYHRPREVEPRLEAFPYPLWDRLAYGPMAFSLLAPADRPVTGPTAEAVALLSFALGRMADYRDVVVGPPVQRPEDASGPLVAIGLVDDNPLIPRLVDLEGVGRDDGLVAVVPNPDDPTLPVLVVTGRSPEGLRSAVDALRGEDRRELLAGGRSVIHDVDGARPPPSRRNPAAVPPSRSFTLGDLDIPDRTVRGFYAPMVSIPLQFEGDMQPDPGGGSIDVVYSYSAQLDTRLSTLEVRLNGVSLRSVPLDEPDGDEEVRLSVQLPYELLRPHSQVDLLFHLFPKDFNPCERVSDRMIWGTVHSSTRLTVPRDHYVDMPDLERLRHRAWPFSMEDGDPPVVLVPPDEPDAGALSALAQLAAALGRMTVGDDPDLRVLVGDAASDAALDGTLPVLLVADGAHGLYGRWAAAGRLTTDGDLLRHLRVGSPEGEGMAALEAVVGSVYGTIEQVRLPWRDDGAGLVLRAPGADRLRGLVRAATTPRTLQKLDGNLVVATLDGGFRVVDAPISRWRAGTMPLTTWMRLGLRRHWLLVGILTLLAALLVAVMIRAWAVAVDRSVSKAERR